MTGASAATYRVAAGLLAALALARLGLRALGDIGVAATTFAGPDDALYYLQIAWHLAQGLGSSFDGLHPTNGYQPAWCLLLAGVAELVPDRMALLRAAGVLASVLHVSTGVLLARLSDRLFARPLGLVVLVLWCFFPDYEPVLSLEAPLAAFAFALSLTLLLEAARVGTEVRRWLAAGVALALLVLARLDHAVLAPALSLTVLAAARRAGGGGWRSFVALAAPSTLALGGYLVVNQLAFGAPLPVSGTVKESLQREMLHLAQVRGGPAGVVQAVGEMLELSLRAGPVSWMSAWVDDLHAEPTLLAMVGTALVAAAVFATAATGRGLRDAAARDLLAALALAVLVHFAFMVYMVGAFPRGWHWGVEGIFLLVAGPGAVVQVLEGVARQTPRWMGLGAARWGIYGFVCAGLAGGVVDELERARSDFVHGHVLGHEEIRGARYFDGRLPAGTRVGAWNAGYLAYFSDLTVVNLDGLVNAPDFRERVREEGWLGYLRAEGIQHLIESELEPNFTALFEHGTVRERVEPPRGAPATWLELNGS